MKTSNVVRLRDIKDSDLGFSPSAFRKAHCKNTNQKSLKDLLSRPLDSSDKGRDVGSDSYLDRSTHFMIRAKALQEYAFLPILHGDGVVPILPASFRDYDLKQGDILISKDSNIGEVVILGSDLPNHSISGAIYKLPIVKSKLYILAMIKSDYFRAQMDQKVSHGSTIRHAKKSFLECNIPFPNGNNKTLVMDYVESLVDSAIRKEYEIQKKHKQIIALIEEELNNSKAVGSFNYSFPKIAELVSANRMDAAFYDKYLKENVSKITAYTNGYETIEELGYEISRGQNLQVSAIGDSIYSERQRDGYYTLILPKNLSIFGTISRIEYLGNARRLKTLKEGDIVFGAEGFEKGRSIIVEDFGDRAITNIHGITLSKSNVDLIESSFVKCFLDYLREKGLIDLFAVGGNGGSLAQTYWSSVPFPRFPSDIKEEIFRLYCYSANLDTHSQQSIDEFKKEDETWTLSSGISPLDRSLRNIKNRLTEIVKIIVDDGSVSTDYGFLKP